MADKIKLTFLGTSSAVPTKSRNHPSILLQYKEQNLLFDCGEGTQRQFRKAKLNPCKLTKIFISHWHGDHILGLPGLLQTLALNGYNNVLEIYGPLGTKQKMKNLFEFFLNSYLQTSLNENFKIKIIEVKEKTVLETQEFKIESIQTKHNTNSLAYSFILKERTRIDKEKLKKLDLENSPLIGELAKGNIIEYKNKKIDGKKLIYNEPSKKITYISDTTFFKELIKFSLNSNILISESTYSSDDQNQAKEFFHLTSHDAANIAKESKSKTLLLFHLSQRYSDIPKQIEKQAKEIFKNSIVVNDLDSFEI